jgi:hypothetical protein
MSALARGIIASSSSSSSSSSLPPPPPPPSPPPRRLGQRKRLAGDPRTGSLLARLPRRDNTLDQHAFVRDLPAEVRAQLRAYLVRSFPGSPEVACALLDDVAVRHPTHLRVKELLETVEACKHAGAQIATMLPRKQSSGEKKQKKEEEEEEEEEEEKRKKKKKKQKKPSSTAGAGASAHSDPPYSTNGIVAPPTAIYDIACGHGLAGVLMAYRFPTVPVVCVDRKRRPCFESYLEAFAKHGKGNPIVDNLRFVKGDVTPESVAGEALPHHAFVLCIHGCNEVSTIAMDLAVRSGGGVCILPCCIRDKVFGVKTKSQFGRWHMEDDVRYSCQVGFLAGKYKAEKIAAIDRRITNRHLAIVSSRVVMSSTLPGYLVHK